MSVYRQGAGAGLVRRLGRVTSSTDNRLLLFSVGTFTRSTEGSLFESGSMGWYGANVPRIDASGAWLFEESRTNLFVSPEDVTSSSWIAQNSAAFGTADAYVAPDGVQDADGVTLAAGSGSRVSKTAPAVSLNTTYITTAFALSVVDITGARINILPQGGVETAGADTALTSTWTRLSSAAVGSGATGTDYTVRVVQVASGGVAGTLSVWGVQVEAGSFPTSYSRLGTGTARGKDSLTITSGNIPAALLSGTWSFRVKPNFAASEAGANRMIFSFPGGGATDGIFITSAGQLRMDVGGSQRAISSGLTYSRGQELTVTMRMGASASLEVSGGSAGNGVYTTGGTYTFTGTSGLFVGSRSDDSQPLNGRVSEPVAV